MTEQTTQTSAKYSEFSPSGSNQSGMRAHNERLVLSILRKQGPTSKAEIARTTGLSAQTVSVIMRALETDGLLQKGPKLRGKIGQPSVPMCLAPGGAYSLGVKVGRRSAELILVDFVGRERAHVSRTYTYPTPKTTLEFILGAVERVCEGLSSDQKKRIAGMGIASPFFLWEWANVVGVKADEMAAWKDFDLRAEVAALFSFPVYLENDASCACGAELVFGTGTPSPSYLYIYIGHFVGGGVVLNGNLYTGPTGNAGALGPFPHTDSGGRTRQLVEVASLIGLERRFIQEQGNARPMLEGKDGWDLDQVVVDDWISEAAPALSRAILAAISFIDFPLILIDGNMPVSLRRRIVEQVGIALNKENLSGLSVPRISEGSIGARARPLGAASLPLAKRFMLEA